MEWGNGLSDAETVRITAEILHGEEAAFDRFYQAYADRLHAYILVTSGYNEEITRDCLQETMLRVIRYMKPFASEFILWKWLTRLGRTALIDLYRVRRKHHKEVPFTDEMEISAGAEPIDTEAVFLTALRTALASLPEKDRALVEAFYTERKSHRQLADEYQTTPRAIEARLGRLRQKVRQIMTSENPI